MLNIPGGDCCAICRAMFASIIRWALEGILGSETGTISTRPSKSALKILRSSNGTSYGYSSGR